MQSWMGWVEERNYFDDGQSGLDRLMADCLSDASLVSQGCEAGGDSLLDRLLVMSEAWKRPKNYLAFLHCFVEAFPHAVVTYPMHAVMLLQTIPRLSTLHLSLWTFLNAEQEIWEALIRALAAAPSLENLHLSLFVLPSRHKLPLICSAMRSVPGLKALRIQLDLESTSTVISCVDGQTAKELNEAMVILLEQNTIEELAVDGFVLLDHVSFYGALANNTSLKVLDISFFINTPGKRESLLQALQTNRTLESIPCWNYPYSEGALKIWYLVYLDRLGRKKAFDLETSKENFVELLDRAIHYSGDRLGHPNDGLFQVQMAFGLLMQRPSLWTD